MDDIHDEQIYDIGDLPFKENSHIYIAHYPPMLLCCVLLRNVSCGQYDQLNLLNSLPLGVIEKLEHIEKVSGRLLIESSEDQNNKPAATVGQAVTDMFRKNAVYKRTETEVDLSPFDPLKPPNHRSHPSHGPMLDVTNVYKYFEKLKEFSLYAATGRDLRRHYKGIKETLEGLKMSTSKVLPRIEPVIGGPVKEVAVGMLVDLGGDNSSLPAQPTSSPDRQTISDFDIREDLKERPASKKSFPSKYSLEELVAKLEPIEPEPITKEQRAAALEIFAGKVVTDILNLFKSAKGVSNVTDGNVVCSFTDDEDIVICRWKSRNKILVNYKNKIFLYRSFSHLRVVVPLLFVIEYNIKEKSLSTNYFERADKTFKSGNNGWMDPDEHKELCLESEHTRAYFFEVLKSVTPICEYDTFEERSLKVVAAKQVRRAVNARNFKDEQRSRMYPLEYVDPRIYAWSHVSLYNNGLMHEYAYFTASGLFDIQVKPDWSVEIIYRHNIPLGLINKSVKAGTRVSRRWEYQMLSIGDTTDRYVLQLKK